MKVPLRWLGDLVDIELSTDELMHRLTMAGLEAENVTHIGAGWSHVFVGDVVSVTQHPDADRLVLADVHAGEHQLTVVTGAPNIEQGQKVALALAGARLFDAHAATPQLKTLKPGAIRGVRSEGMVCSEKELGLSEEHEGILVLEADAPAGSPLVDWLGETVVEFEITPNLVHAFSVLGIAREVGAVTSKPVRQLSTIDLTAVPVDPSLITIEAGDLCPRCTAMVIDGVRVGPSPGWLSRRLVAAGLRPINNLVDITNYVMLEWGQPLHAYDRTRLDGGGIIVRRAAEGERLETLDHQQRELSPDMLVIADGKGAVGVAGVMGGVDSEVDDQTTSILLEAATFNMTSIRHTARALKLRSDASVRFERGLDPNLAAGAAARAAALILELCPGSRVTAWHDVYPSPVTPRPLTVPFSEIERLLGVRYDHDTVLDALRRLQLSPSITGDGANAQLTIVVPTYRQDLNLAADIVEEVARIVGYETLPATLPSGRTVPVQRDSVYLLQRAMRSTLVAAGCSEVVTYITASRDQIERLAPAAGHAGVLHSIPMEDLLVLRNPIQSDKPLLRPTLVPALLEIAAENLKHQPAVRLFELARVYLPAANGAVPREANVLAILLAGERESRSPYTTSGEMDYFDLKGVVDALLSRLSGDDTVVQRSGHDALHPGRRADILIAGHLVATLGELRPDRAEAAGLGASRVSVAELDLDAILARPSTGAGGIAAPRFLPAEQDFAVIVAEQVDAAAVEDALRTGAGPLLSAMILFDIYRGAPLDADKKSLAYRLTFTAPDRAMTDADLGKVRTRIERTLRQRVDGRLRT